MVQKTIKADSHITCRAHAAPMPFPPAMPCRWGFRICLSHLIYTMRPCLIHTCHAMPTLCSEHAVLLNATAQHVRWETACGLTASFRLLPATTWSSTKVVITRIPISDAGGKCETKHPLSWTRKGVIAAHYKKDDTVGLAVLIFPATMRTFTKVTALSGHGRGAAWHVWINARYGKGTAWERHAMCESALTCHMSQGLC
jgi:hypothetical protein